MLDKDGAIAAEDPVAELDFFENQEESLAPNPLLTETDEVTMMVGVATGATMACALK